MRLFLGILATLLAVLPSYGHAQKSQKITLDYKAYWAGIVVADITSETIISADHYQIKAHYQVSGFASLFKDSQNDSLSRGIILANGQFRPTFYQSGGNFGKFTYFNQAKFDPYSLKVSDHIQELQLRKDLHYTPIDNAEKYGIDPLTLFLNMITNQNFTDAYQHLTTQRQFGGMFVSEQSFLCDQQQTLKPQKRSLFHGVTSVCTIDGKLISGDIKSTKKRKKSRVDDDQKSQLWFGKMQDLAAMLPVYTEFSIGWGKVRIYLSGFNVETIDLSTQQTE